MKKKGTPSIDLKKNTKVDQRTVEKATRIREDLQKHGLERGTEYRLSPPLGKSTKDAGFFRLARHRSKS